MSGKNNICQWCNKLYNKTKLAKKLGEDHVIVIFGFCSEKCYNLYLQNPN